MPTLEHVTADLARAGYAHLDASFFGGDAAEAQAARCAFAVSCGQLPPDEHGDGANRNRRHGVMVLLPWSDTLLPIPPVWDRASGRFVSRYLQSAEVNPEQQGKQRSFAPLTEEQRNSPFLHELIWSCFRVTPPRHLQQPIAVGLHLIQLVATPGSPGVSSPNYIHQDHEPFTFAALIDRMGVTGGENLIAVPEAANRRPDEVEGDAIIERFTLEHPWNGWVVDDKKVSHYVSPVEVAQGHDVGRRTVLLIDFTPMVPATQN